MSETGGTMHALVLTNGGFAREPSGSALEAMEPYVEPAELPVPEAGPSQVLIRVALAAVNPADVMFLKGLYGQPRVKGRPPGFEGVGEVVAAGAEAPQGLVGKRVAFATGLSGWGAWAEYAVAEAAACIPLVDTVGDVDGAALIVNPLTALAMFDIVREEGEKAFVLTAAASQLCKLMMGVAREAGFRPIALVRRDDQAELLRKAGAAHVLNAAADGFADDFAALCREERPRVLLDAVTGPLASQVFHLMPKRARWIIYGRLDAAQTTIPEPGQMIFMHKRIEGFWLTEWMRSVPQERRARAVMEAQTRFSDGRWHTDVTATVPLGEAMGRLPDELARPNGKVFVKP